MTNRQKGLVFAILGPLLWGLSGNVAQWLFAQPGIRPDWLVAVRLLLSGVILLVYNLLTQRSGMLAVARDRRSLLGLFVFGVFGVVISQFTYFTAVAVSNAPTTTVIQYLGPVFIIIYLALRHWRWPRRIDLISIAVAFVGVVLLVTHGRLTALALSPQGLFWGLAAAVGAAAYTLMPVGLLRRYNARLVTGWGMLFGGLMLSPVLILQPGPRLTWPLVLGIGYVTLFGTLVAYLLYLESLRFVAPTTVAMLNVFEPLSSTVIAIALFHAHFGWAEVLGGLLVLSTTFLQVLPDRSHQLS
ncbi:DMT family transporter [Lacticaseibacillus parakribbianus]|uniref:DMT family transporter n=1 Tax=Lacticaseibacillus parakribbianus TaxID=2970927 RepID=UPI0021CB30A4|nr:DMT family transporter [Lacticaseibacillus parakribbianus]